MMSDSVRKLIDELTILFRPNSERAGNAWCRQGVHRWERREVAEVHGAVRIVEHECARCGGVVRREEPAGDEHQNERRHNPLRGVLD